MEVASLLATFLGTSLFGLQLAAPCSAQEPDSPAPMNVLFIAIDDLRPELGCYGSTAARTPHMDAFAATALRFDRHFVQAPSCGPSRYALLTGRSPAASGALANEALYQGATKLRPAALSDSGGRPVAQSLPEAFRRGGYHTVCIGKISHTPDGRVFAYSGQGDGDHELPHAWDELATPFGPWKRGWGAFFAYANGEHREDGENHRALMQFTAEKDTDLPDGLMAAAAAQKLRELKAADSPFFLGVGFYKPHLPFVAPRADWEAMAGIEIEAPASPPDLRVPSTHRSAEFTRYDSDLFDGPGPRLPLDAQEAITARRAYLACVRYVDRQVGVVLDALESEDLADSTIVVLWGDHGWHLGESGVWGKHTVLDRSLRSVLIVRAPGVTKAGSATASLVASIDLAPTLLALASLSEAPMAAPLDGIDLTPVLRDPGRAPRTSVAAYFGPWGTVRTDRYRLVARRTDNGWAEPRLFDCSTHPDPTAATELTSADLIQRLLEQLPR
ncbi:Choline-sulfatase [Planctomycetes bacterium Poly30]|uniref:Choline-sulfatase n=1 Tax=Saltatorellus ferox TaxID=2528018 RepID=A0A518EQA3_9BACT|nr:Choline-sulfatase [Planctomycetes bacterium Poly30]